MLTAHPQFARATVNMFWAKLMGVGIVEPFDEFDLARQDPKSPAGWEVQPSHPELLDELAADFREHNYSLRQLFRTICRSSAYQLSARFDGRVEGRLYPLLRAQVRAHADAPRNCTTRSRVATSRPGSFKLGDEDRRGMAMASAAGPVRARSDVKYFMQTSGNRIATIRRVRWPARRLQPLLLMQSPVVNDRVLAKKDSRVERLLASYKDDNARVVDELFLATLSRPPSDAEKQVALGGAGEGSRGGRAESAMGAGQPGRVLLQLLREPAMNIRLRRRDLLEIRRHGPAGASAEPSGRSTLRAGEPRRPSRAATRATCCSTKSRAPSAMSNRSTSRKMPARPRTSTSASINADVYALAPAVPAHGKAHRQARDPALHAQPRRGALPRAILHADRPPVESGLRARDSVHRLGDRHGTGAAPPSERHVPDLHVVQPRQGLPRRAVHRLSAAALLGGRYQSRRRRQRHGARREGRGAARRALAPADRAARDRAGPPGLLRHARCRATRISTTPRTSCSPTAAGPPHSRSPKRTASATATRRSASPASWRATCSRRTPARTTSTSAIPAGTITSTSGTTRCPTIITSCARSSIRRSPACSKIWPDAARRPIRAKTLLDETLVVVMGEFGRTPGALNNMAGRDHHNKCYPAMFAGAGVKADRVLGRTDSEGAEVPGDRLEPQGAAAHGERGGDHVLGARASTGARRSATRLPAAPIRTSIRWARTATFRRMTFRLFTASLLLCHCASRPPNPAWCSFPAGEYPRGRTHKLPDDDLKWYPDADEGRPAGAPIYVDRVLSGRARSHQRRSTRRS